MRATDMMRAASTLAPELVRDRRYIHINAGTGFDIKETYDYVDSKLTELGISHRPCGRAGIVAMIGGKRPGKVFLLRADMDALPIREESGEEFSAVNGKMHACGHDMHAAMLLGAARLLKDHEDEIEGTVKLMFQPAEEIVSGADDMIRAGVLEAPAVDAALMIHVIAGVPLPSGPVPVGTSVISDGGVSHAAADVFAIRLKGKGSHGAAPQLGIDPLLAGAHILVALEELHARELGTSDEVALTFGSFQAGTAPNVIADSAEMSGTMRTFDEQLRAHVKERMEEIASSLAKAFRVEFSIEYTSGCPIMMNDPQLSRCVTGYAKELLGDDMAFSAAEFSVATGDKLLAGRTAGSEDFAFVSQKVPALMIRMLADVKGHNYPLHHPKARLNEEALPMGAAVYAYVAMRWLEEHK